MYVVKRDGHKEPVMFDKITARVKKLCYGLNELVDPVKVAMRVIEGLYDNVSTSELDNLAAEIAATMTTSHPDYAKLAARISVSNLQRSYWSMDEPPAGTCTADTRTVKLFSSDKN